MRTEKTLFGFYNRIITDKINVFNVTPFHPSWYSSCEENDGSCYVMIIRDSVIFCDLMIYICGLNGVSIKVSKVQQVNVKHPTIRNTKGIDIKPYDRRASVENPSKSMFS